MYLHSFENYSDYLNGLIDRDLAAKQDPSYIARRRRELKAELADLDKSEKTKSETSSKFNSLKESCFEEYKRRITLAQNGEYEWSDSRFRNWIKKQFKENGISQINEYQILDEFKAGRIDV